LESIIIPSKGNYTQGRRRKDEIWRILVEKDRKTTKLGKKQKELIRSMHEERLVDLVQKKSFKKTLNTISSSTMH